MKSAYNVGQSSINGKLRASDAKAGKHSSISPPQNHQGNAYVQNFKNVSSQFKLQEEEAIAIGASNPAVLFESAHVPVGQFKQEYPTLRRSLNVTSSNTVNSQVNDDSYKDDIRIKRTQEQVPA